MLKSTLIVSAFVAVAAALFVVQNDLSKQFSQAVTADPEEASVVSRNATSFESFTDTGSTSGSAAAIAAAVAAAKERAALADGVRTDNSSLRAMTDGVLSELGLPTEKAAATDDAEAQMRAQTAGVLQGIRAIRGDHSVVANSSGLSLQGLVVQALREGQSDTYIDALLNEAATKGAITVPRALVTSDGRVDTPALLADIVAKAVTASSGQTELLPTEDRVVGGEGVEVRVVQQADGVTKKYRFYTVSKGDSLGAIAVKFYGDVSLYSAIFDANRAFLSSPDKIRTGQRLVIPTI